MRLIQRKIEEGESDLGAIKRELSEEIGYVGNDKGFELLDEYDFISKRGDTFTHVRFRETPITLHE